MGPGGRLSGEKVSQLVNPTDASSSFAFITSRNIGTIGMASPEEKLVYGRDGLSKINMDLPV